MKNCKKIDVYKKDSQEEWKKLYKKLKEFIAGNPEIKINDELVKIPGEIRPEFYSKFDKIRDDFISQKLSKFLKKSNNLSNNYLEVEKKLMECLDLKGIRMPNNVHRFLHCPLEQLRRELFDLLLELLKEKIDFSTFTSKAIDNLYTSFKDLYERGYKKWFVLYLLKQFEPEKIYHVPLSRPSSGQLIKHPAGFKESVPMPVESDYFSFEVGSKNVLLPPDAIIYSSKIDKYVAFRTQFGKAMWQADTLSNKREWYSFDSLIQEYGTIKIRPDLLIYIEDGLSDISLVSDSKNICRPDIIIELIDSIHNDLNLWEEKINDINYYNKILKPTRKSFIVSEVQSPEEYTDNILFENINLLEFNSKKSNINRILSVI